MGSLPGATAGGTVTSRTFSAAACSWADRSENKPQRLQPFSPRMSLTCILTKKWRWEPATPHPPPLNFRIVYAAFNFCTNLCKYHQRLLSPHNPPPPMFSPFLLISLSSFFSLLCLLLLPPADTRGGGAHTSHLPWLRISAPL